MIILKIEAQFTDIRYWILICGHVMKRKQDWQVF